MKVGEYDFNPLNVALVSVAICICVVAWAWFARTDSIEDNRREAVVVAACLELDSEVRQYDCIVEVGG